MMTIKQNLLMCTALAVLGASLAILIYGIHHILPAEIRYDCSIAEISPDIPVAVREECRKKLKESNK